MVEYLQKGSHEFMGSWVQRIGRSSKQIQCKILKLGEGVWQSNGTAQYHPLPVYTCGMLVVMTRQKQY